jgi:hypothetical protein
MVEYLQSAQSGEESCVAFLYCSYRRRQEQSAEALLAMLLRQLAEQCASIPESMKTLYTSHVEKKTRPSPEEIFKALSIVTGSQGRVFLVVDALDECSDETRRELLAKLQELQTKSKASLLITSRRIDDIERQFAGDPQLEIRASEEDVEKYIDKQLVKLSECVRENAILKEKIKKCIAETVDGM